MNTRVLVVDDERSVRRFLRTTLTAQGYRVFEATDGASALAEVRSQRPDLVILDLGLPDLDGTEVTRQLREWTSIPILILSVRDCEIDKIEALDAGADDYLTKPFGVGELMARLRAAMRRMAPEQESFSESGLEIDFGLRRVSVKGVEVKLTPTEYDLLRVLTQAAGQVLTHSQLLRQVWGPVDESDVHTLGVNISNLRRKLGGNYILTEPGVGYRLGLDG